MENPPSALAFGLGAGALCSESVCVQGQRSPGTNTEPAPALTRPPFRACHDGPKYRLLLQFRCQSPHPPLPVQEMQSHPAPDIWLCEREPASCQVTTDYFHETGRGPASHSMKLASRPRALRQVGVLLRWPCVHTTTGFLRALIATTSFMSAMLHKDGMDGSDFLKVEHFFPCSPWSQPPVPMFLSHLSSMVPAGHLQS